MGLSLCVGNYATTPYCITSLGIQVYCMEELCYCLRENAFLLDFSVMDEYLIDWIDNECGVSELANELYLMVRKQGTLSAFVTLIMEYVGLYDAEIIQEVERVLKEGSGLSGIEKRKKQIDYLVRKKKYPLAVQRYDDLLMEWNPEYGQETQMPGEYVKAEILHNKGVALAHMMVYGTAAECFRQAYEIDGAQASYEAYLAAKRMELEEREYLAFIAQVPDSYEKSLALEKRIEQLEKEFASQESGRKISELRLWRFEGDKQKYYDELERITRVLKENYRNSVGE